MLEPTLPSSPISRVQYLSRAAKAEFFLESFLFSWTNNPYSSEFTEFNRQSLISCELGDSILLQKHFRFRILCRDSPKGDLERKSFTLIPGCCAREQRISLSLNLFLDRDKSPFTIFCLGGSKALKFNIGRPFRKTDLIGPLTPILLFLRAVEFGVRKALTQWTGLIEHLEKELTTEAS